MQSNQFMDIKINGIDRKFSSLWLKSVYDVKLDKHCINCLVGERDYRIKQEVGCEFSLAPTVYYLCGVTYPYVWANNFHLAFQPKEGSTINITRKGLSLTITNAEEIMFSEDDIDKTLPNADDPKYYTCRNWQFANYFNTHFRNMLF